MLKFFQLNRRARAAVILLVLWALFSSIHLSVRSLQHFRQYKDLDEVSHVQSDVGAFLSKLPCFGEVGFLEAEPVKDDRNYFATQYALIPRVVVRGLREWSIRVGLRSAPVPDGHEIVTSNGEFELIRRSSK